ncbi:hypothetical protein [Planomicrobium sp. Y74]|uniref:hypothetical protein n=1 Tax=Planomicrobium sp. Y74 TaxID=2478977 RepID=UPI000EF43EF0|nr:hypothetical protein [Planomicrobium sp. Y74]RLQ92928.1 hypothetical protein D9754_02605 [Planomicrobium sp. Y74]
MTARFSSVTAYIQDAFLISFVFLFIDAGARFPLVLIWLGLVLASALTAAAVSWRKPYNPAPVLIAAGLVMALSLFAGVAVGTFIVLTIISLYRLHARFSEIEDKSSGESFFLILFLVIFTIALVLSIFNPLGSSHDLLFPVAAAAIIFYTVSRLFYRYLNARQEGAKFWQALIASTGIIAISGLASFLVYLLAEETRQLAGSIFGGILAVVLWPFAGVLNWLVNLVNGISSEEEMLDNLSNMEEQAEQTEDPPYSGGMEFDYTIIAGIGIVLAVIIGILLIRKIKPDLANQQEESIAEVIRLTEVENKAEELEPARGYNLVDIHEIRKAFREFETQATEAEKGRMEHETVREWAHREELPFTEFFFRTYDKVRYSDGSIAASEASPFVEELEKINKVFFRENV